MNEIPNPGSWPSSIHRVVIISTGAVGVALAPGWVTLLKGWYDIEIRILLSHSAETLVSKKVLGALTKNPVLGPEWKAEASTVEHREIAEWADLILVVPATANYITKLSQGNLDSLALYVPLMTEAPVVIAPSLPPKIASYPPVKRAIEDLSNYGIHVLDTTTGLSAHSIKPEQGGLVNLIELVNYVRNNFGKVA